jgi:hypothetical protein
MARLHITAEADGIPRASRKSGKELITIKLHDNKGMVAYINYKDTFKNGMFTLEVWDRKGCQFIDLEPLHTPRLITVGKKEHDNAGCLHNYNDDICKTCGEVNSKSKMQSNNGKN